MYDHDGQQEVLSMISRNLFFIVTWALLAPSLGWTQETSDRLLSTHISGGTYKDDSNGSLLSDFARENNLSLIHI